MSVEIIVPNGDLKREVWSFLLMIDYSHSHIFFNSYSSETRETKRHKKWTRQNHWERLNLPDNTMESPNIPTDVLKEMHLRYQILIPNLPIVR